MYRFGVVNLNYTGHIFGERPNVTESDNPIFSKNNPKKRPAIFTDNLITEPKFTPPRSHAFHVYWRNTPFSWFYLYPTVCCLRSKTPCLKIPYFTHSILEYPQIQIFSDTFRDYIWLVVYLPL